MKKLKILFGIITGILLIFPTGCQEVEKDQSGNIVIKITDSPFPIDMIDEATVSISIVEMRLKSDGEEEEYPFTVVFDEPMEFNLLELRNGVTADLIDMDIPAGSYDLIRLYVDEASLSVKDHETYNVKVPSGSQTGIKIFIEPALNVAGGLTSEVLLDFNVDRSFVLKGNVDTPAGIKGFNFKPVIRAVNNSTSGGVEGVVIDADSVLLQDVSVWIEKDTVITTAYTDVEGYYAIPGISAGYYSLSATKEGFDTITYADFEIVEGNMTIQNFTLNPAEEE